MRASNIERTKEETVTIEAKRKTVRVVGTRSSLLVPVIPTGVLIEVCLSRIELGAVALVRTNERTERGTKRTEEAWISSR